MQIVITAYASGSVVVQIYYDGKDMDNQLTMHYADWKHALAELGKWLPLTNCEIHIQG